MAYLWFAFKIPITMDEMLMLTLWPSWCILLKIYALMKEMRPAARDAAVDGEGKRRV